MWRHSAKKKKKKKSTLRKYNYFILRVYEFRILSTSTSPFSTSECGDEHTDNHIEIYIQTTFSPVKITIALRWYLYVARISTTAVLFLLACVHPIRDFINVYELILIKYRRLHTHHTGDLTLDIKLRSPLKRNQTAPRTNWMKLGNILRGQP